MCYTCKYSLCKGCIKDADYLSVRGNNGLCGTCMRTVMLIESLQGDKEAAQVDFDDKSGWEYLFKMYWVFLKEKLSLTSDELTRAKNPWKGVDTIACKGESSAEHYDGNDYKGSKDLHLSFKDLLPHQRDEEHELLGKRENQKAQSRDIRFQRISGQRVSATNAMEHAPP
jgi:hypothetical protein